MNSLIILFSGFIAYFLIAILAKWLQAQDSCYNGDNNFLLAPFEPGMKVSILLISLVWAGLAIIAITIKMMVISFSNEGFNNQCLESNTIRVSVEGRNSICVNAEQFLSVIREAEK